MLSKIKSASLLGIDAIQIDVEVNCAMGLPTEYIVGLPDTVIRESRNRIKTAIKNSGFDYPTRSYTINLAPADIPKEGAIFDLPIAIGILQATGQLDALPDSFFVGELSLDGSVKPIKGIVSISDLISSLSSKKLVAPLENCDEASLIQNIDIYPIQSLNELTNLKTFFNKTYSIKTPINHRRTQLDYKDVKGQEMGKRAVEIAAAGRHNILFVGPPGSGKSMLLQRLPSIMPRLTQEESISNYKIQSISKEFLTQKTLTDTPAFRTPHHSISYAGMVGGGSKPQPGEISLAHNGILFLDELPEFNRQVLEVLRQPLETKCITISRASLSVTFPANFMLVAAMNPCPCGFYGDTKKPCKCTPQQIARYQQKLSGPILDRFDLIVEIPRLKKEDYTSSSNAYFHSEQIKKRVLEAREIQQNRYKKNYSNSNITVTEMNKYIQLDHNIVQFLANLVEKGHLTARSHDHVIKIAQTISDLNNEQSITETHILESLQYRSFFK